MGILGSLLSLVASAAPGKLSVGDPAPKLTAKTETGKVSPIDIGSGYTLVYFYPKADTPGCTAQACSLRDHFADLTKQGVHVYGVSTDTPEDQMKFKEKYHLPFTLIADTDKKVASAFGVPVTMNFAARQAYLFKDGKLVWLDKKASTKEQADDVLKVINGAK